MTTPFTEAAQRYADEGLTIARVVAEHKEMYSILVGENTIFAEVTGRLMYFAGSRGDYPAVGDWVAVQLFESSHAIIHYVLPRRSYISRKTSGKEFNEQLIAANVDIVFIVQAVDASYNIRRLERFLVVAAESGATPVVLLSKTDLITDEELTTKIAEVSAASPGVRCIAYSSTTMSHIEEIRSLIGRDTTVCFIGSSGVGKSTLINRLIGKEILATNEVREEDARGRHTTTHRQLLPLETGGFVIDTPGMRELGLWNITGSIDEVFPEIGGLAAQCKFADCTHTHEPGCAVQAAVASGIIPHDRFDSYQKLKKEAEFVAAKSDIRKQQERKARDKQLGRAIKAYMKTTKKK